MQWFDSSQGRYLLAWEQACMDAVVADIFGYHSLQLGMPLLDALRSNRMPHQWLALEPEAYAERVDLLAARSGVDCEPWVCHAVDLMASPMALPFSAASLDLVVLPHTLELCADPHAALREVERVLVPEGRVVISGLNPTSLWGGQRLRSRLYQRMSGAPAQYPEVIATIGHGRLRDWLRLLNFELQAEHFGCYRPAVRSAAWLDRFAWMDRLGERWWPILGAAYVLVAVKRVPGMHRLEPAWRKKRATAAAIVPVANKQSGR